jgi:hypothetical protein
MKAPRRLLVTSAAVIAATTMAAARADAQLVQYHMVGTFNCSPFCSAGNGTGAATFGGLTLAYRGPGSAANPALVATAANPAQVDLTVINPTFASFGSINASGGTPATASTLGGTFTLSIFQVNQGGGSGDILGSLTGTLTSTASGASLTMNGSVVELPTAGIILYDFPAGQQVYNIVPPSTNGGVTSLQGRISRGPNFGVTAVPEPATVTLLAAGLLVAGVAGRRRRG